MSHDPPRLLYVGNDAGYFVSHRLPLALRARAAGFDVHVTTPEAEPARHIRDAGFPFYPIPLNRQGKNIAYEALTLTSLVRLFRQVRPDIIHNATIKPVIYGGMAARIARVPAVVSAVTGLGSVFTDDRLTIRLLRGAATLAYRAALQHPNLKLIFQNSDDQADFEKSKLLPPGRSVVIPGSGVDTGEFTPQPFPPGVPVVLMPSRMMWEKGVGDFVEAARILKGEGVQARFVLAGAVSSDDRGSIPVEQLRAWTDEGVVEWQGFRADMARVFAESHVVCMPSYYREGIPKALIEAAACGRPIVTTDAPGCREITHDGENGLLVPRRDVPALAAALRRLIEDGDLRERMGARGRAIALDGYDIQQISQQIIDVYWELLANAGVMRHTVFTA